MFNRWRQYPKRKPKEKGYYLCTVKMGDDDGYVLKLFYNPKHDRWSDIRRQKLFDGYVVYKVCRAPIEENRVYTDGLCDRTDDVVAWKKLSDPYISKKKARK